jgi:hypothetical protein
MRWRAVALVLLAANVLLAATWLIVNHQRPAANQADANDASKNLARTNYVVRKQIFSWREIESPDYPTFISNLRSIDCPEQTIRDIIIADVNALYSLKRATNLVTSEQQWWRTQPDPSVVQAAADKSRELEDERRALLTNLLGTNWEAGDMASIPRPSRPGVVLDGALLGTLSSDSKAAVEDVIEHPRIVSKHTWKRNAIRARIPTLQKSRACARKPEPNSGTFSARRNSRSSCSVTRRTPTISAPNSASSNSSNPLRANFETSSAPPMDWINRSSFSPTALIQTTLPT